VTFALSEAEFAEAVATLRDLLRIDTTNPPGNERPAAELIAEWLRADGLSPEFAGATDERPNLICKLPCDLPAREKRRPLVLSCHLDVVPADPARWKHPPFAGVEAEGCLWGRGAIDMKGFAVMALTVFRLLKRRGVSLDRDLIFAAVADEEAGAELGSQWLVEHRPDLLGGDSEYVLNEVGGFTLHQGGRRFYPVQIAEKGIAWLRLTAHGRPGHSSLPNRENALADLAWAIDRIARARLPWHPSEPARAFLTGLAGPVAASLLLQSVIGPRLLPLAIADPDRRAAVEAILRNTANPTLIRDGGSKINVIPGAASVEIDGRLAPGQTAADLIRELRAVLRDPNGRKYEIEILKNSKAVVFSPETPLFHAIRETVVERDPGSVVVPSIVPGFTDSKNYARLGATCYGFYPLRLPPELNFAALFHGDNERIPLDGFRWGIETLGALLVRFLGNR
jgi:acetylornithine deacetylase/succinyl-diaminopimelate desuccinylase-like protein